jgi:hypothetical protein
MSTITLGRRRIGVSSEPYESDIGQQGAQVSIDVRPQRRDRFSDVWQQFNDVIRVGLERSGFRQPEESVEEREPLATTRVRAVLVAPGIMVRADEFEERYGGIDLEGLKGRMTPAVFKAFVRHIGSVPGRPDLDVDRISAIPDVR